MSKKTPFNPSKLSALEVLFGTQKKAARHFGVSPSTFRAWKNGLRSPPPEMQTAINRSYGQRKPSISDDRLSAELAKREAKAEKLRQAALKGRPSNVRLESTRDWLQHQFGKSGDTFYIKEKLESAGTFAAHPNNDQTAAQLFDDPNRTAYGRPAGTKSITVYALYHNKYIVEDDKANNRNGTLITSKIATRDEFDKDWSIEKTLDYIRRKLAPEEQRGNVKFLLTQLLGYKIND